MINCGAGDRIEMAVSLLLEMLNSALNQYLHAKYMILLLLFSFF